jgi:hypothetical protein
MNKTSNTKYSMKIVEAIPINENVIVIGISILQESHGNYNLNYCAVVNDKNDPNKNRVYLNCGLALNYVKNEEIHDDIIDNTKNNNEMFGTNEGFICYLTQKEVDNFNTSSILFKVLSKIEMKRLSEIGIRYSQLERIEF